jgi:sugar phosphate isomerase/epimerase
VLEVLKVLEVLEGVLFRSWSTSSTSSTLSTSAFCATFPPMQDRRSFLSTCGAALLGAACSRAGSPQPDQRLERIGVQLYTVRRDMARDFEGTLTQVAAIGYREVEFAGYHGKSASEVRAILARLGLAAPASHISLEDFRRNADSVIGASKEVGHRYLVVPWLDPSERRSIDDYRRVAEELNRIGEKVRAAGMQLGYHNHDFELMPMAGSVPLDVLIERTDPSLLVLELDLYWVTKGGADPLTYFSRNPGRVHLVHVKDSAGAPEHRQVDVGQGTIDFAKLFARREQAGIRHAFVELDEPVDALKTLQVSYEHLARLRW